MVRQTMQLAALPKFVDTLSHRDLPCLKKFRDYALKTMIYVSGFTITFQ